jgi:hypothetical protein
VNRKEILVNLTVTRNVSVNIFFPQFYLELILCDKYVHKQLQTTAQYVVSLVGQLGEDE